MNTCNYIGIRKEGGRGGHLPPLGIIIKKLICSPFEQTLEFAYLILKQ